MRIITGSARGTRLFSPIGDEVRPTTEMAKEGVFSAIQFDLEGRSFLDLFAGSGQMGLEALSRGAREAVFVDCSEDSLKVLRKNIEKTGLGDRSRVVRSEYGEYIKSASRREQKFDFVYADPPYGKDLGPELVKRILRADLVKPGGVLMVETDREELDTSSTPREVLDRIEGVKRYKFSKCYVFFVRVKREEL